MDSQNWRNGPAGNASRQYQRRMAHPAGMAGGAGGVRFGLGSLAPEGLDGFEILWPNGVAQPVLQDELRWDAWLSAGVTQKRGLVVSCPFLYADDGSGFRFLTDIVGIAPLDEWLPAGAQPRLDPEEYVRIPRERLRSPRGRLRLAIRTPGRFRQ